jgi:acetyl esterase/lipase
VNAPLIASWLGLVAALGLLGAARFCVRAAKTYRTWWVALVATELGHVGVLLALTVAAAAALRTWGATTGLEAGLAVATSVLAGGAAVLFARPAWTAWRMSARVAADVEAAFAAENEGMEKLWSWRRLWGWPNRVARSPVERFSLETGAGGEAGLPLDFYRARKPAGGGAAEAGGRDTAAVCVVVVHGGGWDSGDRGQLAAMNHWLAARGVAVAAVSYRLAPAHPWPAQRDDLRAAIEWVRENSGRLGVDRERLVLFGRSAGAQIAAATAYGERLPGVRALVALYGCYDLEFVWLIRSAKDALNSDRLLRQFLGGGPDGAQAAERYRSGSAEKLVHAEVPPTLMVHGVLDELVWCRHSERLAAALARAGVRHAFVRLPWATHAGDANLHGPSGQLIAGAVLRVARARG